MVNDYDLDERNHFSTYSNLMIDKFKEESIEEIIVEHLIEDDDNPFLP